MFQNPVGKEENVTDKIGVHILRSFFEAYLDVSADYMGIASNTMLYRAGEMVGEHFSGLNPDALAKAMAEIGMHVIIQENGGQWTFTVEDSIEATMCTMQDYKPCCHMLRGFFSAYLRAKTMNPYLRCTETECSSTGGDFCRFVVSP